MADPNEMHTSGFTRAELQTLSTSHPSSAGQEFARQALAELDSNKPVETTEAKNFNSIRHAAFAALDKAEGKEEPKKAEPSEESKNQKVNEYGFPII